MRSVHAAAVALLLVGSLVGTTTASAVPKKTVVAFYGDSLSYQAIPYLPNDFDKNTTTLQFRVYPGTAICDWLPNIDKLTAATAPKVALLEFAGNNKTACMKSVDTQTQLVDRYRADLTTAITTLRADGVQDIVVDRGPATPAFTWFPALLRTYQKVIASFHSSSIVYATSADAAVETSTGKYTRTLPCLFVEIKLKICKLNQPIVVRAPDEVHFCPLANYGTPGRATPCPVYASGGARFAGGLASAIWKLAPETLPW